MTRDQHALPDNALRIPEGFFFADSVVPEIGVPSPESILVPMVTEGFQVAVVVVTVANLEMHDHPFLFSVDFSHRFLVLPGKDTEMLQRLKIIY